MNHLAWDPDRIPRDNMRLKTATTKSGVAGESGGLLFGKAVRADAADFSAGNSDLDVAVA